MVRSVLMEYIRGRVIHGMGKEAIPDGVVSIDGGRISAVGPASEFNFSHDLNIHEVDCGTILPGIIDSHVHTDGDPEVRRDYLTCGVTSICDLGSPLASMPQFEDEPFQGKSMARGFRSGPILTVPGGLPGAIYLKELNYEVGTAKEAQAGVADLVEKGADIIKVYLDPWFDGSYPTLTTGLLVLLWRGPYKQGPGQGACE